MLQRNSRPRGLGSPSHGYDGYNSGHDVAALEASLVEARRHRMKSGSAARAWLCSWSCSARRKK